MKINKGLMVVLLGLLVLGGAGTWYVRHHSRTARIEQAQRKHKKTARAVARKNSQLSRKVNRTEFLTAKSPKQQITKTLKLSHFVGTALVVKDNRVIYHKGFGYANRANEVKNGPASKYQILSIQKSLTAVGIMQLVQAGKVKLSDPITKYYPTVAIGRQTTIRQMLDMTTGYWLETGSTKPLSEAKTVTYALNHMVYRKQKVGIFNYSAVNYVLLAGIIRKETGQSYQHFVKSNIIHKLGLKQTGFVIDGMGTGATIGYKASAKQVVPKYQHRMPETKAQMHNELGTGQIYMSAADLFKVESAILKGKLITKPNVLTLHTRTATGEYGGGVYNISNGIRSHGLGYGYESDVHLSADGKTGVVLLSNYRRRSASIEFAANKIFSELMNGGL
ncbi:class A beta-lactamase-related serine hydrolase [Lactiplantibacillus garii]|uniref:Class A beta-lactamase-related serine hydrolase n=1 Tax=Lactiplantibacillus garii TaxID=2306423 RepID=A0A426D969_9LACO|nr:serine hydrolase domain-containing protein [Lactiplantibacillus garii]RRK11164.1 class A beta-lactamase-related serine hydrolase [Lactiplantibacillus garii]